MTDLKSAYRQLPQLSFAEKKSFCDLGFMPLAFQRQMAAWPRPAQIRAKMYLYEAYCGCSANSAKYVKELAQELAKVGGARYFPNIMRTDGVAAYDAAINALDEYQRVKKNHGMWAGIELAAREGWIGLDATETKNTVDLNEEVWKGFLQAIPDEIAKKLQSHVEGKIQDAIKDGMKMSEAARLRLTVFEQILSGIEAFEKIRALVKVKELANKPKDHPDAIRFKVSYFIGLVAAKGPEYFNVRLAYETYDRAFRKLAPLRDRELFLRRGGRKVNQEVREPPPGPNPRPMRAPRPERPADEELFPDAR